MGWRHSGSARATRHSAHIAPYPKYDKTKVRQSRTTTNFAATNNELSRLALAPLRVTALVKLSFKQNQMLNKFSGALRLNTRLSIRWNCIQ
jgi:hypothetical protein